MNKIRVWDLPTRLGHWSLAASFVTAELTSDSEKWRNIHVKAGYVMLAVILFRIVWGLCGSRHARWSALKLEPSRIWAYAVSLLRGQPQHYTGHNPLGGIAILFLLGLGLATVGSGVMVFEDWGPSSMDRWHERAANGLFWMVGVHLLGVLVSSLLHRENLVGAMIAGNKLGEPGEAINASNGRYALWILVMLIALAIWLG